MKNEKTNGPTIGKSAFQEEGAETAIEMFIRQTTKACKDHNEPLPNIVKNYKPGDTVLYRDPLPEQAYDPYQPDGQYNQGEFDLVNNNTDEREIK